MTESATSNEILNLKWGWNNFESTRSDSLQELRLANEFFDVTLCSDNGTDVVRAHKVILAAGSNLFRRILSQNRSKNAFLYLKGIHLRELESLVNFIYHGEVKIEQESLDKFLTVADEFGVKGLANANRFQMKTSNNGCNSRENSDESFNNSLGSSNGNFSSNNTSALISSIGNLSPLKSKRKHPTINGSNKENHINGSSNNKNHIIVDFDDSMSDSSTTNSSDGYHNSNNRRPSPLNQRERQTPDKIYTIPKRRKVNSFDFDVDDLLNAYVGKVSADPDLGDGTVAKKPVDRCSEVLNDVKIEDTNPVEPEDEEPDIKAPMVLTEEAKFSKTQRGKPMLIDADGYTYLMDKNKSDHLYWACRFARTANNDNCRARAVTKGFFIAKKFNHHNHEPRFQLKKNSL